MSEQSPSVDALTKSPNASQKVAPDPVARAKRKVLILGGAVYAVYVLWCLMLLVMLPDPAGANSALVGIGVITAFAGIVVLVGAAVFGLKRISSASTSILTRRWSLIKLVGVLLPGLIVSAMVPLLITREPRLPIDIVDPKTTAEFVAPVAVTFSVERAVGILRELGLRPQQFQWDTEGDGKVNEETVVPRTTVVYDRQGSYMIVVRIQLEGGEFRRLTRRITIPVAVFSVAPVQPVVENPVKFSVKDLMTDPKSLKSVRWDFGDGETEESTTSPDALHTYYAVGSYPVTAVVQLQNQSQATYKRTITVRDPPPLPFPIALETEPSALVGPSPLGVLFRLETKEPLRDIAWSFGDGSEDRGAELLRASHSFESAGIYPVTVRARSMSGSLAELTKIVRVTEVLNLRDLSFDGSPNVINGKISGSVPLSLDLTPKTAVPLVTFSWEVPSDPNIQVDGTRLRAVYREEGTYGVTLLAQGAEGKSMRMPINIEVGTPEAAPTIVMQPDSGTAPLEVTFDASQSFIPAGETVAGFKWFFGDERQGAKTPELGTARVRHTYVSPGEYTVELHVVFASGKESVSKRTLVVRRPVLRACIEASRLTTEVGKGVEFDATCSTGTIASLLWDVRKTDASSTVLAQSNDATYVYVFAEAGEYTVTLTAKDSFGNEEKKSVQISVTP